jgi:hypothetical protein
MKLLLAFFVITFSDAAFTFADPAVNVPKIAKLGEIRVGLDTVEALERSAGPGLAFTGGHPEGNCLWQSKQTGWYLRVDGFYYNQQDQRIIDSLSVALPPGDDKPPTSNEVYRHANIPRAGMLFMNVVSLGMQESEVLRMLRGKLPPPRKSEDELVWKSKGHAPMGNYKDTAYENWTATLEFDGKILVRIDIEAE